MSAHPLTTELPPPEVATEAITLLRRLERAALCLGTLLTVALIAPARLEGAASHGEILRSGALAVPLAAILLCWTALRATLAVAHARLRASRGAAPASGIGRAARIPQAIWLTGAGIACSLIAWRLRAVTNEPMPPAAIAYLLGGAAIATAFLMLIAERILAAFSPRTLPEAPALRVLSLQATGICFAAGLIEIGAGLGLPFTYMANEAAALCIVATSLELSARALGRLFLPPPSPEASRAAVTSLVARMASAGVAERGEFAPLRQHFGIDFSRSWALGYVRAASVPMAGFFLLLAWGLTGATLVPLDGRAVYERFGAPVRVLHPGLHLGLPWPLGTTRALEFGPVHEIGLAPGGVAMATPAGAEDLAPPSADRLWDQAHPGEVDLLIASAANGRQSFQSVSADLRILYRIGLADADAMHAAYATAAPQDLVVAEAGQAVARYFADRDLDQVLGADREAVAEAMRARLQNRLDEAGSGLEAVAVVIEAIHPPAGAADAYHNVRAAQIGAEASVAVERGAAATIMAQARQYAFEQEATATANAGGVVAAANTASLRFSADQRAAQAGGRSFLLERYFGALSASLGRTPKTIIDDRLSRPEAPVLDLRPFAAAAGAGAGKEE